MFGSYDPNVFHSRLLPNDKVEFIYFDGTTRTEDAAERRAQDEKKSAEESVEFQKAYKDFITNELGFDSMEDMRQSIRSSISVTQVPTPLGFDDESEATEAVEENHEEDEGWSEDELKQRCLEDTHKLETDADLFALAQAMDDLQADKLSSRASELANHYVTLHGMGYPCFELYEVETPREHETRGEVILGYRLNASSAHIIANVRWPEIPEENYAWTSADGLWELRRLLYIICVGDESRDEFGIMSETTRWPMLVHVNNGKIVKDGPQREAWERATDPSYKNKGHLDDPVCRQTLPLLVCNSYRNEANTISSWMEDDIYLWVANDNHAKMTRTQKWAALLGIIENDWNWIQLGELEPMMLICNNGKAFDKQLVDYWLENRDLPIPPKRYDGSAENNWKYPDDQDPMRTFWRD